MKLRYYLDACFNFSVVSWELGSLLLADGDLETWKLLLLGKKLFGKDTVMVKKQVRITLSVKHIFDLKLVAKSNSNERAKAT